MRTLTAGEMNNKAGLELIAACNDMIGSGLVAGTWGNASMRVADGLIITPSGMPYDSLNVQDIVLLNNSGNVKSGFRRPSTEAPLHLEIYRNRPDVHAIMHTHSIYASALAVSRINLPVILEEQAQLVGGEVPVSEYAPAGSEELACSASQTLGDCGAVLLANHGLVGVGKDIREALLICQIVEKACRVYIMSLSVGSPFCLDEKDVSSLRSAFLQSYGQNTEN